MIESMAGSAIWYGTKGLVRGGGWIVNKGLNHGVNKRMNNSADEIFRMPPDGPRSRFGYLQERYPNFPIDELRKMALKNRLIEKQYTIIHDAMVKINLLMYKRYEKANGGGGGIFSRRRVQFPNQQGGMYPPQGFQGGNYMTDEQYMLPQQRMQMQGQPGFRPDPYQQQEVPYGNFQ